MRITSPLTMLVTCGAALLLWCVQPAHTAPAKHPLRSVLGFLRAAPQDASPSTIIRAEEDEPGTDIDTSVRVDEPEIDIEEPNMEVDQPDIEIPEPDMHVDHDEPDLSVREQEKIQKSFSMPSAHRSLEIDNVWGSIDVEGTASSQVQLTVEKTTRAESKQKLEQARKDVTLDITEQPDSLKLYVNGPFRCNCRDCSGSREFEGYIVKMDFHVEVPRDTDISIKTVNEGRVSVRDINGNFMVRNVNGDIQIRNITGSGTARTVNGPVKVSFRQNPREASDFRTVNGNIELEFARNLSADFRFKTFNGGIYSDFPVTALPIAGMQQERRGSKVIFRADRYTGARVASGGPQIRVENLNGDIRILENHE